MSDDWCNGGCQPPGDPDSRAGATLAAVILVALVAVAWAAIKLLGL